METLTSLQQEKKSVPYLRFASYKDKWILKRLGQVCEKIQDGNYGGEYPKAEEFVENGIPFLTSKALGGEGFIKPDKIDFITKEKHQLLKKAQLKLHDVLFTNRGSNVGTIGFTDEKIAHGNIGPQLTLLRSNLEIIKPEFLFQLMKSYPVRKQISSQDSGSAMNFFGIDVTSKFKLNIPSLLEQQKIASFLSAVDEKIQLLNRKKQLLEQYKKGVMQQLFSGKLRFKDANGKAYPKWEEKKLGDVSIINMGQSPDSKSYNTDSVGMLLIQGNADINGRVSNPRQWTGEPTKKCEIGDLILTVRAPVGSISKSIHNACIGRGVCAIKNNELSEVEFLYQFLLGFEDKWGNIEQGSTFTAVNGNDIKSVKIKFPSKEEQKKIADFLSAIDVKIEKVAEALEATAKFKKGLLQQMFV